MLAELPNKTLSPVFTGKSVEAVRPVLWDGYPIAEIKYSSNFFKYQPSGLHATINIHYAEQNNDGVKICYNYFNIERLGERKTFSGDVHKEIQAINSEAAIAYTRDAIRTDLGVFCELAHPAWLSQFQSELVSGDPDIPLSYLIDPFLLDDAGTVMYARPGRGKSQTAMTMAVSVDAGINTIWPVRQAPTLYVNLERSARSLKRRLGQINEALGLNPSRPLRMLNARSRSLRDISAQIEQDVEQHNIGFIILDSISRAGMGDLNDNRVGQEIINELNRIIDGKNASYLAIGHTSWGGDEPDGHIYGSIQQEAGADVMLSLRSTHHSKNKSQLGVLLNMSKFNDAPPKESPLVVFEWDTFGLKSIEKGSIEDFPQLEKFQNRSENKWIKDYLLNHGPTSLTDLHNAMEKDDWTTTSSTLSKLLDRDDDFIKEPGHRGKWKIHNRSNSERSGMD